MERKIFNYTSEILVQETIEKFGYSPEQFGRTSGKFVVARCRYCGEKMEIRKGFFNKSGSACHKKCRLEEQKQQISPFKDPKVMEKTRQTNIERYGAEHACQNKEVAKRLSDGRKKAQEKIEATNIKKYGVANVFQSEKIKQKIKETNVKKYGSEHPMQSTAVQEKYKKTLIEKYGVDNLRKSTELLEKSVETFKQSVRLDKNGKYVLINVLRSEAFWEEIKSGRSLKEVCERLNIDFGSASSTLSSEEFKTRFRSVYSYPKTQKQMEINNIIKELGVEAIFNTRSIISPLELDIYVPSYSFSIEFNGSYWHSEACLSQSRARKKHFNKTMLCRQKGIRLFHIFENNWDRRHNQILNFIKSILGKNSCKIMARKCSIDNSCARDFIEQNHIQGAPNQSLKYFNLVYNGEIVASMTASRHHRQNVKDNPVVLSRLCFKDDATVTGGASRLFDQFRQWAASEGYDRILSWSDNCWTEGNIYKVLGFSMKNEYGPDYFYWDMKNNRYVSKQSQRKNNTGCPSDTTERDWCYQNGLYRIHDCGKKLWVFYL